VPENDPMRALAAALLAVAAAVLLGACGSSSSTTTGNAGDTSSTTGSVKTVTHTATRTATASSSTTTAADSSAGAPMPCNAAGMSLSFLGGQGATGHGLLGFALHNTGNASCSTIGYPGIQFLDGSGGDLPTTPLHTTHDFFGTAPLHPLVVAPGQTVSFRLGVTHGAGSTKGCTTAYALQVIPPNDTHSLRVSMPDGEFECTTATVSPLQPGTSAYP
jgi:hypothetical protein